MSNSYGWSETAIDAGYEDYDDVATSISLSGYETLWVWSAGNGGPGYGTTHTVTDFTSVHVGAGTTMMYRAELGMENDLAYSQWGDVIPFSNSGPTRTGKLNAEIIASGAYSMEPMPLNMPDYFGWIGDGSMHFQLGSGTSHAAPTVAGGAALGYQAYHDTWGAWPAMDWAKALLMGTADDMHFDPLKQGSGWLNAEAYADAMSETDGVYSYAPGGMYEPMLTKAASYPGSIYGTRMETFVNLIYAGDYDANNLFVTLELGPDGHEGRQHHEPDAPEAGLGRHRCHDDRVGHLHGHRVLRARDDRPAQGDDVLGLQHIRRGAGLCHGRVLLARAP